MLQDSDSKCICIVAHNTFNYSIPVVSPKPMDWGSYYFKFDFSLMVFKRFAYNF